MWVFPKIGIPQNGWFIKENHIKMDDLGVPLFLETPMWIQTPWWSQHPKKPLGFWGYTRPLLWRSTSHRKIRLKLWRKSIALVFLVFAASRGHMQNWKKNDVFSKKNIIPFQLSLGMIKRILDNSLGAFFVLPCNHVNPKNFCIFRRFLRLASIPLDLKNTTTKRHPFSQQEMTGTGFPKSRIFTQVEKKPNSPGGGWKMLLHHAGCDAKQHLQAAQQHSFQTIHTEAERNAKVHMTSVKKILFKKNGRRSDRVVR